MRKKRDVVSHNCDKLHKTNKNAFGEYITTVNLTDVIQLTLTLKMTTKQVVKTSFIVNNHSPIQDYVHLHNHAQPIHVLSDRQVTIQVTYGYV